MNADDLSETQHPFTQLLLPQQFGYLSCLNQQNQTNAGTYSINHGQQLPAHNYFKLTARYKPHAK